VGGAIAAALTGQQVVQQPVVQQQPLVQQVPQQQFIQQPRASPGDVPGWEQQANAGRLPHPYLSKLNRVTKM
jgi:hypothetical protein